MDIYEFINSKDIRAFLKEKRHKFNSLESAWLVRQSMRHTIREKHAAYQKIMELMPNMKFYIREWDYVQSDFHEFLKKYINIENKLIKTFESDSPAVFSYVKGNCYKHELYRNKDLCLAAMTRNEGDKLSRECFLIYRPIISNINENPGFIAQCTDSDGECVIIAENSFLKGEESKIFNTFSLIKPDIPLPFRTNDRVIERYNPQARSFLYDSKNSEFGEDDVSLWTYQTMEEEDVIVNNYLNLELDEEDSCEVTYNEDYYDDCPF